MLGVVEARTVVDKAGSWTMALCEEYQERKDSERAIFYWVGHGQS